MILKIDQNLFPNSVLNRWKFNHFIFLFQWKTQKILKEKNSSLSMTLNQIHPSFPSSSSPMKRTLTLSSWLIDKMTNVWSRKGKISTLIIYSLKTMLVQLFRSLRKSMKWRKISHVGQINNLMKKCSRCWGCLFRRKRKKIVRERRRRENRREQCPKRT